MFNCRVCQSPVTKAFKTLNTHGRYLIDNQNFQLFYCQKCQAYSLESVEQDPKYYSSAYPKDYYPKPNLLLTLLQKLSFLRTNLILQQFPSHNNISILDVGCGQGEFLKSLPDNKFTKFGLELNPDGFNISTDKGLTIINGDINKVKINRKFDCITLWHVLEHLPDPQFTIQKLYSLLNPGGILILATPNSSSLGFKYGKELYFHLDSPRHLFIPNQISLSYLLVNSGFKIFNFSNPFYDFPLDLFWSLRHSLLRLIIYPFYPVFKYFSRETIYTIAQK